MILLRLVVVHRSSVYAVWAAVFLYFLADDSLEVHETAGEAIATGLSIGSLFGIDGRDVGQVLVSGTVGLVVVVAVSLATINDQTPARSLTIGLVVSLIALATFGVVIDVVDALDLFGIVEDGGEMLAMSLALIVVLDHRWRRSGRTP